MARRWLFAPLVLLLTGTGGLLGFACASTDPPLGASAEAGIPDANLGVGAWGATTCAACTFTACDRERGDCRADPGCARNLDCIMACPSSVEAEPEPGCVARCPLAQSSASETPRLALERCRTSGRATDCPTCAAAARRRYQHPLLTSTCENPTYDAGLTRDGAPPTPTQIGCRKCIGERCCDGRASYLADPSCDLLLDCLEACTDPACRDACFVQFEGAITRTFGYLACPAVRCNSECLGEDQDPCIECTLERCADPYLDCQTNHYCILLVECGSRCSGGAQLAECRAACDAKFPGGVALAEALTLCSLTRCPSCP